MSNYRDDTQETAVASDSVWAGLSAITSELGRVSDALIFGLLVLHVGAAVASDEVIDRTVHVVEEVATVSDLTTSSMHAKVLVIEARKAVDSVTSRTRVLHEDAATVSDAVLENTRSLVIESAAISDEVIGLRTVTTLTIEKSKISDLTGQFTSELVTEDATASDSVMDKARMRVLLEDGASISDSLEDGASSHQSPVHDQAQAVAMLIGHLHAFDLVTCTAVIEDEQPGSVEQFGQAWTANTDTWAMSRYDPYSFYELAVIDGMVYGMAPDGLYALQGGDEKMQGEIRTARMDLSGDGLVHPTTAYLEYELHDDEDTPPVAEMDVTTTQDGQSHTFTYVLARERADELTNGRFNFGRGLRGRHFSFALRLIGQRAHINDLRLLTVPTKRRV